MKAQYSKVIGNCIICGIEAELYQQPEESGFRAIGARLATSAIGSCLIIEIDLQ